MKKVLLGMMLLGTMAMANNSDADVDWDKMTKGLGEPKPHTESSDEYILRHTGNDSDADMFIKVEKEDNK